MRKRECTVTVDLRDLMGKVHRIEVRASRVDDGIEAQVDVPMQLVEGAAWRPLYFVGAAVVQDGEEQ